MQNVDKITVENIYNAYIIPPTLQEHMYLTASLGRFIALCTNQEIDVQCVTEALLLHDMGNIIKFDFRSLPGFIPHYEVSYWQEVQQAFINRYGYDEDQAHVQIAEELGVNTKVIACIQSVGFSTLCNYTGDVSLEYKICAYADLRVSPYGITTLGDRLKEAKDRYNIKEEDEPYDSISCAFIVEQELDKVTTCTPSSLGFTEVSDIFRGLPYTTIDISKLIYPFSYLQKV